MVVTKTCVFGYHHLFARNRIPGTGTGASPSSPRTLGRGDGLPGSHIWTCPKLTYVFSTTRLSSEGESSDVRRFSAVRGCGGLWYSRKPQHGVVRRMLTSSIACRPHWAMTRLTAWKHWTPPWHANLQQPPSLTTRADLSMEQTSEKNPGPRKDGDGDYFYASDHKHDWTCGSRVGADMNSLKRRSDPL